MPDKDDKQQSARQSGSIFDRITGMANAAREAAEEAEQAGRQHQSPLDRVREIAETARRAAENARQQAEQAEETPVERAYKAAEDAAHKARWARIEAEAAQRAEEARRASEQEEFQGSGGVGSQEQLDTLRRGYIERGLADPSGLTANSDSLASNLDVDVNGQGSGIHSTLNTGNDLTDEGRGSQGLTGGRDLD